MALRASIKQKTVSPWSLYFSSPRCGVGVNYMKHLNLSGDETILQIPENGFYH